MRCLLILGSLFIISATYCLPSPCESNTDPVASEDCNTPASEPVHYMKETLDTVSKNSTLDTLKTKTKTKEKVKVKHLKGGLTEEIIVDNTSTKTKKKSIEDDYSQTNRTRNVDGLEDFDSLTTEDTHETKETDTLKDKKTRTIIRDANGNVVSDTTNEKVKEKIKKKEKDHSSSEEVHTQKQVGVPED